MDFNLLAVSIDTFTGFGQPFGLNFIGKFIKILIESFNSIGIGIIIFTLVLKLITLPLDIISRTSMKKNNLKMERIRPQLEKLQRQYANNKELYNRKIQALYKKEGYSMFASCLPTLVTLVIFILVINQFSAYSNFTNVELFNKMSQSYNTAIENYDKNYIVETDDNGTKKYTLNQVYAFNNAEDFNAYKSFIQIKTENNEDNPDFNYTNVTAFGQKIKELNENGWTEILVGDDVETCHILFDQVNYSINKEMFKRTDEGGTWVNLSDDEINLNLTNSLMNKLMEDYTVKTIKESARQMAKQTYIDNAPSFLWIKNIWTPDLPYKHPVNPNLENYDFYSKLENKEQQVQYNEITFYLQEQKTQANGYFILVVLSIGTMLLQQLIMNKAQKAQMELQTVDGQGAMQSKMMMWMLPIMFGVFSFMYSASFSLYMTVSTIFSLLSTLIINFFVEKAFNKKYGA